MRRLALCCVASVLIWAAMSAFVLDRPVSLGTPRARVADSLDRAARLPPPRLVILAGSNGPYSHRCETMEPMVERPCINAGIAVGIGLDYLFARWRAELRRGDAVYLPLEFAQYARSRAAILLGPDATIMLRHDRATLLSLGLARAVAAPFATDARGVVMSLVETALAGVMDPRRLDPLQTNAWGDRTGHDAVRASAYRARLDGGTAAAVVDLGGAGTEDVAAFLRWAAAHGVRAIGGLPTGFADAPPSTAAVAALRDLYETHGAAFVALPNLSRYPRTAFYDSPDHLHEDAQIAHSRAVAAALRPLLGDATAPAPERPL